VLERNSAKLRACLASAAKSHERAAAAINPGKKEFFQKMETSWMRLAASIASVKGMDFVLREPAVDGATSDHCRRCEGTMRLKLVEASRDGRRHTFECLQCGYERIHDTAD